MNITNVNIKLNKIPNTKIQAFASIVIEDSISIHGIKIIGYTSEEIKSMPHFMQTLIDEPIIDNLHTIITMPSIKTLNGEHKNVVHPLNTETRNQISSIILAEYEKAKQEA